MTEPRVPARVDRATALTIAARIHTGRGTSPYRIVQDAEVIADYLRTGEVVEDPALAEAEAAFKEAIANGHGATMWIPGGEVNYEPPQPRRRWWQRRPLDPVAIIGLMAAVVGLAAGLMLIGYLATVTR